MIERAIEIRTPDEGAHHGWTSPDSPAHDAKKAERASAKLGALLAETLRSRATRQEPA